jgi:dTDP-4-dehydrorhamnose reductase
VYAPLGHNFVRTMRRLGAERNELRVVYDQVGAPTYARDLAAALLTIVDRRARGQATAGQWSDVYNFANEGVTSWYDFALSILEDSGIDCRVEPILSAGFPTPAQRPPFSLLNKDKIKAAFGLSIPHWRESLRHCLGRMEGL